jgi:phosphopantetheine adenylyltransferase
MEMIHSFHTLATKSLEHLRYLYKQSQNYNYLILTSSEMIGLYHEERMEKFEERMEKFEERMVKIEERMVKIEERMEKFEVSNS